VKRPPAPVRHATEAELAAKLGEVASVAMPAATVSVCASYVEARGSWWTAQMFVATRRFRFATWAGTYESRRFGGRGWMESMTAAIAEKAK
jgi:hypothetical protein